jgi:hypothetical protein
LTPPRGKGRPRTKRTRESEEAIRATIAKAPVNQRRLADGRVTETVLIGMAREWEEIRGGSFESTPTGSRWAHLSDDAQVIGGFRPMGLSADLCAISDHAMARTFASGYREVIIGNAPPVAYWTSVTVLEDAIPVALSVLDRELTGAVGFLDWYLQTPCWPRLCLHHPDDDGDIPYCGSATCATASPGTPCDCVCGGANHGTGEDLLQSLRPSEPGWSTTPAPVWQPGSGTVEIDREHRRVIGRDPFGRHGTRVRATSKAWTHPDRDQA